MDSPRDHGLVDSPHPIAPPVIVSDKMDERCPNCKGKCLFMIEVRLSESEKSFTRLLNGDGPVVGLYAGCAACPYASSMVTTRKEHS